ncbi:hypothetical protein PAMP_000611 [Pampus punctatissimus]
MSREGGRRIKRGGVVVVRKQDTEARERGEGEEREAQGRGSVNGRVKAERGHNQFSSPNSIMSSPVSIDLRIKLLRDLRELQSDQCSGNVGPDVILTWITQLFKHNRHLCDHITDNDHRPLSL